MNQAMLLNLLARCLRDVLYNHCCLLFDFYLLYVSCGADRHRPKRFFAVVELRIVIDFLILEVLEVFYGQTAWYPLIAGGVCNLVHIILAIYLMTHFNGPLGKVIFAGCWTETFAVGCMMASWAFVYWGTGEIYTMSGQPFQGRDILVLAVYFPLCFMCSTALKPMMHFYRNYQLKHPRWWLYLGLLAIFSRFYTNFYVALPRGTYRMTADLLLGNTAAMLLMIVLRKRAKLQKQVYLQQQRSVEMHLEMLREQAAWVMDSRAQLEEQIAVMESLPQKEQAALAEAYLNELKTQYHTFLAGIRCKDPLVDALLCYWELVCRQKGISTEFSLQQYDRGKLEEQEIVILLLILFDGAVHNCLKNTSQGHVALSMIGIKGQFFLEMHHSGKQKLAGEGIRPVVKRHDGIFRQKRTENGWQAEILLEAGSAGR